MTYQNWHDDAPSLRGSLKAIITIVSSLDKKINEYASKEYVEKCIDNRLKSIVAEVDITLICIIFKKKTQG